jgi:hypothetical protein
VVRTVFDAINSISCLTVFIAAKVEQLQEIFDDILPKLLSGLGARTADRQQLFGVVTIRGKKILQDLGKFRKRRHDQDQAIDEEMQV